MLCPAEIQVDTTPSQRPLQMYQCGQGSFVVHYIVARFSFKESASSLHLVLSNIQSRIIIVQLHVLEQLSSVFNGLNT